MLDNLKLMVIELDQLYKLIEINEKFKILKDGIQ